MMPTWLIIVCTFAAVAWALFDIIRDFLKEIRIRQELKKTEDEDAAAEDDKLPQM
jgi:hypothetical protein